MAAMQPPTECNSSGLHRLMHGVLYKQQLLWLKAQRLDSASPGQKGHTKASVPSAREKQQGTAGHGMHSVLVCWFGRSFTTTSDRLNMQGGTATHRLLFVDPKGPQTD
jgi:hypothetical protein